MEDGSLDVAALVLLFRCASPGGDAMLVDSDDDEEDEDDCSVDESVASVLTAMSTDAIAAGGNIGSDDGDDDEDGDEDDEVVSDEVGYALV